MSNEIIKIDNKYSIEIKNHGAILNLLRYDEQWSVPLESKCWISVFYRLQSLETKNAILEEARDIVIQIYENEELLPYWHEEAEKYIKQRDALKRAKEVDGD